MTAYDWAFRHAAEFGADPGRLTISGHSVGGHLVAMALATDWQGVYGLPADLIKGAVAISGLYDLGFVPYSYVQPKVQASWDQVRRLSPIHHLPASAPPLRMGTRPRARMSRIALSANAWNRAASNRSSGLITSTR